MYKEVGLSSVIGAIYQINMNQTNIQIKLLSDILDEVHKRDEFVSVDKHTKEILEVEESAVINNNNIILPINKEIRNNFLRAYYSLDSYTRCMVDDVLKVFQPHIRNFPV